MQCQQDYDLFKKWFFQNGGLVKKINFPARFGPTNYLGLQAKQRINKNEVILAVPKKIIITVAKIKSTVLGPIIERQDVLNCEKCEENQFNIIILFIIWQKMLGQQSFYFPYLQAIGKAETIISWPVDEIESIQDPYISAQFVEELKKQLPATFKQFHRISVNNPQIFEHPIEWSLFMECFQLVTTRCFGWGLPDTMLVPYADFLNHSSNGVYHYVLNRTLEGKNNSQFSSQYVSKKQQLDLTLLGIQQKRNNNQYLTKIEQLIETHSSLSQKLQKQSILPKQINLVDLIQYEQYKQNYDFDLCDSSNSEDNDSEDQTDGSKQQMEILQLNKSVKQQFSTNLHKSVPKVNREFDQDTKFNWWDAMSEDQSYFVVSAHTNIEQGEQIFNSYGRRSNKFLLIWYGFTHAPNKYDSVAFRLWSANVNKKTGKMILAKFLTEKDWLQKIRIGNQRCSLQELSIQFRLKIDNICYQLMAYLRRKLINSKQQYKHLTTQMDCYTRIYDLELQTHVLEDYQKILQHVSLSYQPEKQRLNLSDEGRNYFVSVLLQSNAEIIAKHMHAINKLKIIVGRIRMSQSLKQILKNDEQYSPQAPYERKRWPNIKFVICYFKMLSKYEESKSHTNNN